MSKLRVLHTEDVEAIVRQEFGKNLPLNLRTYLTTFNMICRKHRLAIVQTEPGKYPELIQTAEIELDE